jgi:phage repressor protein C with HTH and peptisase S24 domain
MSGDRVMVNMSDKQISQSGIFVIYDGDGTVVKRVDKRIGDDETVTIISDNTIHERYQVPISYLNVIGRVVWVARRL